jgi:ATP-binding cassette subfamily B protein
MKPVPLNRILHHLRYFERAIRFVWQGAPGWTLASVGLMVLQGLLPLVALYLLKLIIDTVTAALALDDPATLQPQIAGLILLAGLVALISIAVRTLATLVGEAQSRAVTDHMHEILHAKSLEIDLAYYENSSYHDTLHRAQQEAPLRPTYIVNGLLNVGRSGLALLAITALLASFNWIIVLLLFLATAPGMLVRLHFAERLYSWQRSQTGLDRYARYFHWMLTSDSHAKETRLFNLGPVFRSRFRMLRQRLRREQLGILTRRSLADLLTQSLTVLAVFGSYGMIAYQTVYGAITLGALVMYFQAFQRGQESLQALVSGLSGLYEHNLFLTNLYEFLDLQSTLTESAMPHPLARPLCSGIVFNQVQFQYAGSKNLVFEDLSFHIRPGEHVAFVGENGVGKTTLVKLLCRLYDPTAGEICIDGVDIRQYATADLRRNMSVVFQDYACYHLTARENIWFGNSDLAPESAQIQHAANQAGAHEVIAPLAQGYDTVLGKWFENGQDLSGGEWQKIALARAFLRDAQIILLDEPSSSLDPKAEYDMFERFHRLAAGRTAILISHRLSTVKMADRIYVLGQGRICESGTHDELLLRNGAYARLFETQAQPYR